MKVSSQIVKDAGIKPKLKLFTKKEGQAAKSTGMHKVTIKADRQVKMKDHKSGKMVDGVRYLVVENGEEKTYDTRLKSETGEISYFVQRMAEISEGEEIILEGKQRGVRNYVHITKASEVETEIEENDHDEVEEEE